MDLNDRKWELLKPFIEWSEKQRGSRRGRPLRDGRQVLNGALWILRTGAQWHDLPARYGPYQTCHRRFQRWVPEGTLPGILWALAEDVHARGKLGWEESFVDASFVGAKKGAMESVPPSTAKGARSWPLQTAMVFLSPYGLRVLRRMRANWSKTRCASAT